MSKIDIFTLAWCASRRANAWGVDERQYEREQDARIEDGVGPVDGGQPQPA